MDFTHHMRKQREPNSRGERFGYVETKERIDLLISQCLNFMDLLESIQPDETSESIEKKFNEFKQRLRTNEFLYSLYEKLCNGLLEKNKEVKENAGKIDEILENFNIKREEMEEIIIQPFSINIILSPTVFDRIFSPRVGASILGVHLRHSSLNFIKKTENYMESIFHENLHNVLDCIDYFFIKTLEGKSIELDLKLRELFPGEVEITKKEISRYLDSLHEELLASSELIENFSSLLSQYQLPDWLMARIRKEEIDQQFEMAATATATAGANINEFKEILERLGIPKENVKYLKEEFLRIVNAAEKGLGLGKRLGKDVYRHILAIMIVLPPTSWPIFIDHYLNKNFGEERIEQLYNRYLLIHRWNGSLNFLRRVNEILGELNEEEKSVLKSRMRGLPNIKLDIETDEELNEYKKLLQEIGPQISLENQDIENIIEGVTGQYYFRKIFPEV